MRKRQRSGNAAAGLRRAVGREKGHAGGGGLHAADAPSSGGDEGCGHGPWARDFRAAGGDEGFPPRAGTGAFRKLRLRERSAPPKSRHFCGNAVRHRTAGRARFDGGTMFPRKPLLFGRGIFRRLCWGSRGPFRLPVGHLSSLPLALFSWTARRPVLFSREKRTGGRKRFPLGKKKCAPPGAIKKARLSRAFFKGACSPDARIRRRPGHIPHRPRWR